MAYGSFTIARKVRWGEQTMPRQLSIYFMLAFETFKLTLDNPYPWNSPQNLGLNGANAAD